MPEPPSDAALDKLLERIEQKSWQRPDWATSVDLGYLAGKRWALLEASIQELANADRLLEDLEGDGLEEDDQERVERIYDSMASAGLLPDGAAELTFDEYARFMIGVLIGANETFKLVRKHMSEKFPP